MTNFNKETYWKRRNHTVEIQLVDPASKPKKPKMIKTEIPQPLRGQGERVGRQIFSKSDDDKSFKPGSHTINIGNKFVKVSRAQARKRMADREMSKKGAKHKVNPQTDPNSEFFFRRWPELPPEETNHMRHVANQNRRKMVANLDRQAKEAQNA